MPKTERTTTINDHEYRMVPLGADAGLDFGLEVAEIVGGPVGAAITAALFSGDEDGEDLDWGGVISAAVNLPAALRKAGGSALFARIFAGNFVRQIRPQDAGQAHVLQLKDALARDEAFGDGNLAEMFEVVAWVIKENYGPFWTALSGRFGGLLQQAAGWLGADLTETLTNENPNAPPNGD
jgi:hypothetical protein